MKDAFGLSVVGLASEPLLDCSAPWMAAPTRASVSPESALDSDCCRDSDFCGDLDAEARGPALLLALANCLSRIRVARLNADTSSVSANLKTSRDHSENAFSDFASASERSAADTRSPYI
jgi:hypothetical protein